MIGEKNFQSNLEYQPPLSLPRTANDLTKTPGNSPPVGPVDDLNQNMITDVRIEQAKTVQKLPVRQMNKQVHSNNSVILIESDDEECKATIPSRGLSFGNPALVNSFPPIQSTLTRSTITENLTNNIRNNISRIISNPQGSSSNKLVGTWSLSNKKVFQNDAEIPQRNVNQNRPSIIKRVSQSGHQTNSLIPNQRSIGNQLNDAFDMQYAPSNVMPYHYAIGMTNSGIQNISDTSQRLQQDILNIQQGQIRQLVSPIIDVSSDPVQSASQDRQIYRPQPNPQFICKLGTSNIPFQRQTLPSAALPNNSSHQNR
jgi:hypothetical protein